MKKKIPATVAAFAKLHGLTVHPINYRPSSTGYDLCDKDLNIQLQIEPCKYLNGDRWMVRDKASGKRAGMASLFYIKRIHQIRWALDGWRPAGETGFKLSLPNQQ
jgi:hypothetical protein